MEFPIKIMIVLFIAITVSAVIVEFSLDTINDSKEKLRSFSEEDKKEMGEDKILEVESIKALEIAGLAKDCYNSNQKDIESKVCFAVLGDVEATSTQVENNIELNQSNVEVNISENSRALKIKYNAPLDRVEVIG